MYDAPSTVAPFLLALILGVSGVAKLLDLSTAADAFFSLRLPSFLTKLRAPQLLPFVELALAVGLLVTSGVLQLLVAIAALAIFIAYLVVIVRALTFDERVSCSCFGKLGLGAVDKFTAVRNAILVALAVATLIDALKGRSVIARWADFSKADWLWLLGVLAGIVLTWLVSGHRGPQPAQQTSAHSGDDEYVRTPIPIGRLRRADNSVVTLRALARTEPALLLYVSPSCGSCIEVIAKARDWQRETDVVRTYLVLPMPASDDIPTLPNSQDFNLLFDPESEMYNLFETGTPTAVLLGADGRLAGGPVVGFPEVSQLMDDILIELSGEDEPTVEQTPANASTALETQESQSPSQGSASSDAAGQPDSLMPEQEVADELEYVRHPTPYGLLQTRDGSNLPVISMADHGPVILLFVSPGCGSCQTVIAATPTWREALNGINVAFVVPDENAALAVEHILGAPAGEIYFDPTGGVRATFQAGTPTMVALGPDRLLLAGPVMGSGPIEEAMNEIMVEVGAVSPQTDETGALIDESGSEDTEAPTPSNERTLAPSTPLTRRDGSTVIVPQHGQDRQQLLAFLSPACTSCEAMADKIPGWRAALPQVDLVVTAYGTPEGPDMEPISSFPDVWFDTTGEFGHELGILTPALMLVGKDGTIAGGPVTGLVECTEFVERIKEMYAAHEA